VIATTVRDRERLNLSDVQLAIGRGSESVGFEICSLSSDSAGQHGAIDDIRCIVRLSHDVTANGQRLLVTHGDLFDAVMQHASWLAHIGSSLYELLLNLNRWMNAVRLRLGLPYWSMSQYVKHQVKNAVTFISHFEHAMAAEARRRGCDGVVCGHIHKAEIRRIDGVLYCNDGDWVESMTALVETFEGELEIIHWRTRQAQPLNLGRIDPVQDAAA